MSGSGRSYYPALDGLRGFAALSVVFYHLGKWLGIPALGLNCDLAVDLFFCLSGFVIPLSYGVEARPRLSPAPFLIARLIRLMPIIALATLVSGFYAFVRLYLKDGDSAYADLAVAVGLGIASIPYFNASPLIGGPQLFPLNGPQYTLFLEMITNLFWFAIRGRAGLFVSVGIAVICFAGLALLGFGGDTTATILLGFPRVGCSFFAGVAVYHLTRHPRFFDVSGLVARLFMPLAVAMVLIFFYPQRASEGVMLSWAGLISPLIILSGTQVRVSEAPGAWCRWAGALSYPIYALHYPIFCWINGFYQTVGHSHTLSEVPIVTGMVVGASAAALVFFDEPARRTLTRLAARIRARGPLAPPLAPMGVSIKTIEPRARERDHDAIPNSSPFV